MKLKKENKKARTLLKNARNKEENTHYNNHLYIIILQVNFYDLLA